MLTTIALVTASIIYLILFPDKHIHTPEHSTESMFCCGYENETNIHIGAQFSWLKKDLKQFNRCVTPWLVAVWHPPWYNSYSSHYQEFECMRLEMEALLYEYKLISSFLVMCTRMSE